MKVTYYKHFNFRLYERYGVKIDKEYYYLLCQRCKNKEKVDFIKKDKEKNCIIIKLFIKDKEVYCVYDKEKCIIRTCLKKDWIDKI